MRPLTWACRQHQIPMVEYLGGVLAAKQEKLGGRLDGRVWVEAVQAAVETRRGVDALRVLMGLGVGVSGEEEGWEGEKPLIVACRGGHVDVVRVLVEEGGVDVDVVGAGGKTGLYWACDRRNPAARVLLELGANPGIAAEDGKTPLDVAREERRGMGKGDGIDEELIALMEATAAF